MTRYSFDIDHSKMPDDFVGIRLVNAYDGVIPVYGMTATSGNVPGPDGKSDPVTGPITPGSHKFLRFEFKVGENAASLKQQTAWIPFDADIPLSSLAPPAANYVVTDKFGATINGVKFGIQAIKDTKPYPSHLFLISTDSGNPKVAWFISDIDWKGPLAPQHTHYFELHNEVYWNADGSHIGPGQTQAFFTCSGQSPTSWPLQFTATGYERHEQFVSFRNIPVPELGQTLELDKASDDAPNLPLKLKSIRYVGMPTDQRNSMEAAQQKADAYTLQLTFTYPQIDKTNVYVGTALARDDQNNGINRFTMRGWPPSPSDDAPQTNVQMFILRESSPPHGSKLIGVKVLLDRETQIGEPIAISISDSGAWSVVKTPVAAPD